jgi:uncharacterized protein DUF3592
MSRSCKVPGRGCLAVWLIGWTVIVLLFDGMAAVALVWQLRAMSFPTAPGVITHSGVKRSDNSDGLSFRLDIEYVYEVDGQRHVGTRYSYAEMGTNSHAWHDIQRELPVGAPVEVAYDPDDPDDSLLHPGLTGFHLFMVWFLTPFNVVMIGGWTALRHYSRRAFDPASRRYVVTTPTGYRVRLPSPTRGLLFGGTLLAITFFVSFVWAFGFGFNPPVAPAAWSYLAAVVVAGFVAMRSRRRRLEIDEAARSIRIRNASGGPVELAFQDVRDIAVVHEKNQNPDDYWSDRYHCELVLAGADSPHRLATYYAQTDAEALATWVRDRIGLIAPAPPADPVDPHPPHSNGGSNLPRSASGNPGGGV